MFQWQSKKIGLRIGQDTLPKAQRTQGIEDFDSFNTFSSKQMLQEALESWSNLSLLFLANDEKYIELWQINVTT